MAPRIFSRASSPFSSLREAILSSKTGEDLHGLPERFERLLALYDTAPIDHAYRKDIYKVITGSVDIATVLAKPTIPISNALVAIAEQMAILSRLMLYLQSRPANEGWAILLPNGELSGNYGSQHEAALQAQTYRNLGFTKVEVVPTIVSAQVVLQPPALEPPRAPIRLEPEPPEETLPNGFDTTTPHTPAAAPASPGPSAQDTSPGIPNAAGAPSAGKPAEGPISDAHGPVGNRQD